jgi:hypothetical protein
MFKSKWVLFLVLFVVVFVGLTVAALAISPSGLSLAAGYQTLGHVCGSVCTI